MNNDHHHTLPLPDNKTQKSHLQQKVVRSGIWLVILRITQQLLASGRMIILACLLLPEDFGILGIALLALASLDTFTQTGFHDALIQKKENPQAYLNAAWTLGLIRGIILFLIMLLSAYWIAEWFDGSGRFKSEQFKNPKTLAYKVQNSPEPGYLYLRENFSASTQKLLRESHAAYPDDELLGQRLAEEFNNIIKNHRLHQEKIFADAMSSERVQKLIGQYLPQQDFVRTNRLILEEVFRGEFDQVLINRNTTQLVCQVIGLTILLGAFSNIGTVYFQKELEFHKQFIQQISSIVADVTVAITLALIYRNVWALVFGKLAGQVVFFIASYMLHPYRPRFSFDMEKVKTLWSFGKWVTASTILGFLVLQGDDIFVGKVIGATALGLYQMAYKIGTAPVTEITMVISRVTFPAYAKLQDNIWKLRTVYLKVMQLTTFLSFPFAGLVFALALDFTSLFLKEKWLPMVPALQILACSGLASSLGAGTGAIFQGIGKPKVISKIIIIKLILLAILIYPFTMLWGLAGTALAVLLNTLVVQVPVQYLVYKVIRCKGYDLVKRSLLPLAATIIMVGAIYLIRYFLLQYQIISRISFAAFFLLAGMGIITYMIVIYCFDRYFAYGIKQIIQEQFQAYFQKHTETS